MDAAEVDLALGLGHQGADPHLQVLGVEGRHVGQLQRRDLAVEAVEDGHGDGLAALEVEVGVGEEEDPAGHARARVHLDVGHELHGLQPQEHRPEEQGVAARQSEVLVVRRDLLRAHELLGDLLQVQGRVVGSVLYVVEGVLVRPLS